MSDAKKLGFIMMLDLSTSMTEVLPMVKIDSKAFVRCGQVGDQFGVNAYGNSAWWVYPEGKNPKIATITEGLKETEKAIAAIENLNVNGCTNIGAAIQLGNQMISQASTPLKAFVLLSDGCHNSGPDPSSVLGEEPPIYIAALGRIRKNYFYKLIEKNGKSRLYNKPNAYEMMLMYNYILSDSDDLNLTMNSLKDYRIGSDYYLEKFTISEDDNDVQLSVVWSDKKYKYTSDTPSGTNINIVLIDPDEKTTDIKPDIAEDGYCIYNLKNVKPGEWKFLIQYSVTESIGGTAGGFEAHTSVKTNLLLPAYAAREKEVKFTVQALRDKKQLDGLTVNTHISRPAYSLDEVMNRFEKELKDIDVDDETEDNEFTRLKLLQEKKLKNENVDILPVKHSVGRIFPDRDGNYSMSLDHTEMEGVYTVDVEITGTDPVTKRPFKSMKSGSVLVG